ncbi:hypothetical protein CYMTET_29204 [Cymbomonas tetramitiformis]|uniref:HAT C-terminal dimerisation domain-containing protein n=1 Tax=Cymbomonas tetramitiformis TaxID=36881 RepID=A0AAE0KV74_9CHLO|nr:hypothetical protein CYMTET_29204 [Cymbomonas tetramitiformis]|eukprot:gene31395-39475_t
MRALDIFSPSKFPRKLEDVSEYGEDKLQTLIDFFSEVHPSADMSAPILDAEKVRQEWESLKLVIFQREEGKIWDSTFEEFWPQYIVRSDYPNVAFLVTIREILPLNTACCERGFSKMGIIMTALRNRMCPETLSALMMCSINGPELSDTSAVHALVLRAYNKWVAVKHRVPLRSHSTARPKATWRGKALRRDRASPLSILSGALDDGALDPVEDENEEADVVGEADESELEAGEDPTWCEEDFVPTEGWTVISAAPEEVNHKSLKKAARIAHRFADKWYTGKFRYISQTGAEKGLKAVYYSDDGLLYFHDLDLADYGAKGKWVILKKEAKKKAEPEPL